MYASDSLYRSAEEYLISAGNRMTRRQLRSCLKAPKVLHQEFLEIPFNHPNKLDIPGCSNKNRYRSIWPNEWTRVKLASQSLAIPPLSSLADPSVNYINANYIRGYDGAPRAFIATQGPLPNTINDFWAMIWQEKCPCVVMMTKLKEKNKVKCEPYLPLREEQYGRIFVTVRTTMPKNGYYVRDIELKKDDETHRMKHFWFTGWPDHKAPTSTANQLLELVKSVDSYRMAHRQKYGIAKSGPITVHCSAGIGRSGCFIATSIGCQQLREENMVDALGLVCQMRLDRGGMIQTPEQYEFVHHALSLYEKQLPETPTSAPMALTSSSGEASENASPSS
uniref:protein-tyrosine-phosphatase n=1 Tax=Plectus sambesii TaxID=2011161 RepID=A0A914VU68_9BILA